MLATFAFLEKLWAEPIEEPEGLEQARVFRQPDQTIDPRLVHPCRDLAFAHVDARALDRRKHTRLEIDAEDRQRVEIDVRRVLRVEANPKPSSRDRLLDLGRKGDLDVAADAAERRVGQRVLDVADLELDSLRAPLIGDDASDQLCRSAQSTLLALCLGGNAAHVDSRFAAPQWHASSST